MAANSMLRRAVKGITAKPLRRWYPYLQALPMAWDIRSGSLTEPDLAVIPYAVHPGDVVVDIGANYGLYCYHLARAVDPGGRVLAFEPIPTTVQTLSLVLRLLRIPNVTIFRKGCSSHTGMARFTIPLQSSGARAAGLAHMRSDDPDAGNRGHHPAGEVSAEVVALDDFLQVPEGITLIKCDVEGAELLALRGARRTLVRSRPIVICEVASQSMAKFGVTTRDLFDFFGSMTYTALALTQEGLARTSAESFSALNCIFVPAEKVQKMTDLMVPDSAFSD